MPFHNVSTEETQDAARWSAALAAAAASPAHSRNDVYFLDRIVQLVEKLQHRYATALLPLSSATLPTGSHPSHNSPDKTASEVLEPKKLVTSPSQQQQSSSSSSATPFGERDYPFPSLFLHSPAKLLELTAERCDGKATATPSCYTAAPPPSLLFSHSKLKVVAKTTKQQQLENCHTVAGDAHGDSTETSSSGSCYKRVAEEDMVPVPLPFDTVSRWRPELRHDNDRSRSSRGSDGDDGGKTSVSWNASLKSARPMLNLDLTGDTPMQQMVQVVLQSEAGLAVSVPSDSDDDDDDDTGKEKAEDGNGVAAPSAKAVSRAESAMAPFLFSPDATSCVIVACRVTLHPLWKAVISSYTQPDDHPPGSSFVEEKITGDGVAAASEEATPEPSVSRFLRACKNVSSAAMVHLDCEDGVATVLEQLVWQSAVPAFLHTVAVQYQHHASLASAPVQTAKAVQKLLYHLLIQWQLGSQSDGDAAPPPPLLHVDWYAVGGIRAAKNTAPVLSRVFHTFFPPPPPHTSGPGVSDDAPEPTAATTLLREAVPLHTLLSQRGQRAGDEARDATSISVAHRLWEEGQCFWSFNTTFQPWCVDRTEAKRYAFPLSWGLLLSVSTGDCWPASIQPGTRGYPLSLLRSLAMGKYHWITPTERGGEVTEQTKPTHADDGYELVAVNTVANAATAARLNGIPLCHIHFTSLSDEADGEAVVSGGDTDKRAPSVALPLRPMSLRLYVEQAVKLQNLWRRNMRVGFSVTTTAALPLPVLFRPARCRDATWQSIDDAVAQHLSARPIEELLMFSTTPHCEPPDFCTKFLEGLLFSRHIRPSDVFLDGTGGLFVE